MTATTRPRHAPLAALLCLILLAAAGGCAKKPLPDYGSAARTWKVFDAHYRARPPAPAFVTACSLAWTSGKKSARILLDIWGGFELSAPPQGAAANATAPLQPELLLRSDAVIRMDAWSNLGGSLSKLREGPDGLAAFYPDQLKAYTHADPVVGARLLGLPFPFSLADFAALLNGDLTDIAPETYARVEPLENGGFRYEFSGGRLASMTLDQAARPVSMRGEIVAPPGYEDKLGGEWRIDFSNYPDAAPTPPGQESGIAPDHRAPMAERLFLTLPGGHRGSLRIQSRELKLRPWPDAAMSLSLPAEVVPRSLDGIPRDWTTGRVAEHVGEEPAETN